MVDPEIQSLIDAIPEDKRKAVWSVLGGEMHKGGVHTNDDDDSGDNDPRPGPKPPTHP